MTLLGYAYDAAGNLSYRTNNALIQNFGVNALNQLTNVTRNTTNALTVAGTTTSTATNVTVNTSNALLYLDRTFAAAGFTPVNGSNTFTAIAKDTLGRIDTNAITVYLPATNTFGYDLNGNLTNDSVKVFEYDDENQLTRVTKTNDLKKEYVYDGKMRLRIRKEFAWRNSAWTQTNEIRFIWDGDVIVQQRDANNLPTLTFTRGRDLSGSLQGAGGIGGLLALSQHSTIIPQHSYYHSDGNGNITILIDANQRQVAKYIYDAFGNPLSVSGSQAFVNPIWFSSQFYDWDTGFLHYKYRIYIPQIQRWLNKDPIGESGFEILRYRNSKVLRVIRMLERVGGINLYGFVQNQPTLHYDSLGLFSLACLSALEQAEAARDMLASEPSPENEVAFVAAVAAAERACTPPSPPPAPKWCPPNRWVPSYIPPMTPPQQKACGFALGAGVLIWVCIILAPIGI